MDIQQLSSDGSTISQERPASLVTSVAENEKEVEYRSIEDADSDIFFGAEVWYTRWRFSNTSDIVYACTYGNNNRLSYKQYFCSKILASGNFN